MLTYSDKTSQSLLSRAEEKIRYLMELNTAVRHEMVGPLQASVELSRRMISHTIDPQVRADGKLILFSSNLVLYLVNDLLDEQYIRVGHFTPLFEVGLISDAVQEVIDLAQFSESYTRLNITYLASSELNIKPVLFDKQRLQ